MSTKPPSQCDVIINGAGLIGSSCALALARTGMTVVVLDKSPAFQSPPEQPTRVSSINHASQNILVHLDVWPDIPTEALNVFERIEVWDALSQGTISFDAATVGLTHLGHIVSNNSICTALHRALNACPNVAMFFGESPAEITPSESDVAVTLDTKQKLRARLLIGADGALSIVRQLASIAQKESSYGHTAIVATVTPEHPHGACARQRFLPSGPLAFLPLANNQCSIVWSVTLDRADHLLSLDDSAFASELAEAFDHRLGRINEVSKRVGFALVRRHASDYIGQRIALIGDAAHTVHPLAGLGANQGFADAAALAQVASVAYLQNRDFATRAVLRRYERWRRGENALVLQLMDGFHALFGSESPTMTGLRATGLNLTDQTPLLKNALMRYAIGLAGDIPQMARAV